MLALENGGTAALAERVFVNVLKSAGIDDGFVVWRLDFATAGRKRGGPVVVRTVGAIGVNLQRVSELTLLADRAARAAIAFEAVPPEIERIARIGSAYAPWTTLVAAAMTAALFARLQNSVWAGAGLAFLAAAVGQAIRVRLLDRNVAASAATLAAAVVSALTAAAGLRFRLIDGSAGTLLASVIYLVPGLPLINGFFDMGASRFLVLGVQRVASAVVVVALMALAVALAVTVMR